MKLATEVSAFVALLRAAVLLLGVGAVALFSRMSPAIDRILAENVQTMEASQAMLAALAEPDPGARRSRFGRALDDARPHLNERAEGPLVARIDALWEDALDASAAPTKRVELVRAIRELSEVNRASMEAADREARRLGSAGAWSVVLLGLLILGASQIFAGRLERRVVKPLLAIEDAARAAAEGDAHRRCPVDPTAAPEISTLARGINRLLDVRQPPPGRFD